MISQIVGYVKTFSINVRTTRKQYHCFLIDFKNCFDNRYACFHKYNKNIVLSEIIEIKNNENTIMQHDAFSV